MTITFDGSTGTITDDSGTITIGSTVAVKDGATLPAAGLDWTNATVNGNKITGSVDASILAGTLPAVDGSAVTNLNAAALSGNLPAVDGSAVTNLSATNLSGGTIPDARLPSNVPNVAPGAADRVLTSDGTNWTSSEASGGGYASMQSFTSSGTWTKPAGIKTVLVKLVASGASGNHNCMGGGAGGYSEKTIDVTSIASVSVTVGAARTSGNQAGLSSSFGSHCSATGGFLGASARGGKPGVGSGGDINLYGGGGQWNYGGSGDGGASYFGGPDHGSDTTREYDTGNNAYGAGGMGIENGYTQYGISKGGLVLVYEYK